MRQFLKCMIAMTMFYCITFFMLKFTTQKLITDRCFGLLLSPGRNVKDGDMHLIEMVGDHFRKFKFLNVLILASKFQHSRFKCA